MKRRTLLVAIVSAILVAMFIIALPLSAFAAPPTSATVYYGRNIGSTNSHAASDHASNSIFPGTTVISVNGTVHFQVLSPHEPYVFVPGIGPKDVVLNSDGTINETANEDNILLDDDDIAALDFNVTFDTPGRYLIICGFGDHFSADGMYGWIIVK